MFLYECVWIGWIIVTTIVSKTTIFKYETYVLMCVMHVKYCTQVLKCRMREKERENDRKKKIDNQDIREIQAVKLFRSTLSFLKE